MACLDVASRSRVHVLFAPRPRLQCSKREGTRQSKAHPMPANLDFLLISVSFISFLRGLTARELVVVAGRVPHL